MQRTYDLEVVAKWYGTPGFGSITLRPPSIDGAELDLRRPWWVDRTPTGSPVTMDLGPEEMNNVIVGDLYRVTIEQMTTVGREIARRGENP